MMKPQNLARIAASLTAQEALEVLIPKGFENLISTDLVEGNLVITLRTNTESGASDVVTIYASASTMSFNAFGSEIA